jgi:hypothetical protein
MIFFSVMSRGDELKAVYSERDFEYMKLRGWSLFNQPQPILEPAMASEPRDIPVTYKKRGRPFKVKP